MAYPFSCTQKVLMRCRGKIPARSRRPGEIAPQLLKIALRCRAGNDLREAAAIRLYLPNDADLNISRDQTRNRDLAKNTSNMEFDQRNNSST